MVGELSQEFLRSQRAAKLAEKMCQCYDLCQALVYLLEYCSSCSDCFLKMSTWHVEYGYGEKLQIVTHT